MAGEQGKGTPMARVVTDDWDDEYEGYEDLEDSENLIFAMRHLQERHDCLVGERDWGLDPSKWGYGMTFRDGMSPWDDSDMAGDLW